MAERREGDILYFSNGGSVVIDWVDAEWIGFSVFHPEHQEPKLVKMTPEDFESSVLFTEDKLRAASAAR